MKLRDYQEMARDFLQANPRAGLFLDMGLGKTAIVLSALKPEHLPALVVAPKRVAEHTWKAERDLWRPDLTMSLAVGDKPRRTAALAEEADIHVISRDTMQDAIDAFKQRKWKTIVIDELSGYKNRGTRRWKEMAKITKVVPHVWGLTGTPSPGGLHDLWAQVYLLDRGERLGTTLTEYRGNYFTPVTMRLGGQTIQTGYEIIPFAKDKIYGLIEDLCLSMQTEGRITLPPLTENIIQVVLPERSKRAYKEIAKDLLTDIRDVFGGEVHTAANQGILTSKLSQIAAGFIFGDDQDILGARHTHLHDEKIKALRDIRESQDSPLLVAYRFRPERDMILEAFPDAETPDDSPDFVERWNRGEIPMLVSHPASVGHGLNLQYGGHTIVWDSLTWNPEEWQQFNKRLLRSGQTQPVVVHIIEARGTVDRRVLRRLHGLVEGERELLNHLEAPAL